MCIELYKLANLTTICHICLGCLHVDDNADYVFDEDVLAVPIDNVGKHMKK